MGAIPFRLSVTVAMLVATGVGAVAVVFASNMRPSTATGTEQRLLLSSATSEARATTPHVLTARLVPASDTRLRLHVLSGPNAGRQFDQAPDASGTATFSYAGLVPGADVVMGFADRDGDGRLDDGEPSTIVTLQWTGQPAPEAVARLLEPSNETPAPTADTTTADATTAVPAPPAESQVAAGPPPAAPATQPITAPAAAPSIPPSSIALWTAAGSACATMTGGAREATRGMCDLLDDVPPAVRDTLARSILEVAQASNNATPPPQATPAPTATPTPQATPLRTPRPKLTPTPTPSPKVTPTPTPYDDRPRRRLLDQLLDDDD